MAASAWPDEVDRTIEGDLTAALAYVTPAGGAVITAVAPIGLRDRERGSVGFTTSLGFGKKLERDRDYLDREIGPRAERYLGPRKTGLFWDRWLQEYYADRVPVDVDVRR